MDTSLREPADTRSMGIVHSALRRDLRRTHMVLESAPYPDGKRRQAIADHILWMTEFLHLHHTGEDEELWPLIRARNPSAGALHGFARRYRRRRDLLWGDGPAAAVPSLSVTPSTEVP